MARLQVSVNRLRKGMVLAEDVYTKTGVILVAGGSPVTKEVVNLLSRHFIDSVSVEYQPTSQAEVSPEEEPIVDEQQFEEFKETFEVAENTLSDNLKDIVYNSKDVNVPLLLDTMNGIIGKSNGETNLCNMLMMMKKNTESLYTHSINVSMFGQILAKWVNCSREEIENVAVAGLLHDIGILKFSDDTLESFKFRDELGGGKYDKHVIYGYNMIRDQNIDNDIKQAVLTHHERMNGSGFPLKIKQADINKISRIIAIADIYDTYTMKEKGVEPMAVFNALKMMEDINFNSILDSQILMVFIQHIADTLIRHRVLLSDGRKGQVVMINKYNVSKPLVQVGPMFIDLAKEKNLFVRELLD